VILKLKLNLKQTWY